MFAFAIRDERRDTLFLARDRFGKKPLFYAQYDGLFVFASEMKAILTDPRFERRIDDEAFAAYFLLSYIPAPLTIFAGIRKLRPGHTLTIDRDGIRERQYWDITFKPDRTRREADILDEFTTRFEEAVRLRLISDVPLGAFLSGGIDSSAVVAFMAKARGSDPVRTFTIGFSGAHGRADDERQYARMVADRYHTDHKEYEVQPDVAGVIEAIVRGFDEPFADDSMIPSYFVCQLARQNVTVALSGLGGDEAFLGYERYLGFQLSEWFNRVPAAIRSGLIGPLVGSLPELGFAGNRINHVKRFVRSAVSDEARRYFGYVLKIAPEYRQRLFGDGAHGNQTAMDAVQQRFVTHYREARADDPMDRVLYCDIKTYLPDDILALTDRMSMCHSLEVRVPFLDHELFEFAATIPSEMKMKWLRKKHLLKKGLAKMLPGPVLSHRKHGFVGPMPQWLRNDLKPYTLSVLSPERLARHGFFNSGTVSRILSDHFDGRQTNDTLIWSLVVFQTWFDLYVDGIPSAQSAAPAA
jgi:asparagine synthase (glutamine-hydrolysing)